MAKRVPVAGDVHTQILAELKSDLQCGDITSPDQAKDQFHGIPLERCLPLQWLLGLDVFPLSRQLSVIGSWGSLKSSFCEELAARFIRFGGMVFVIDTEKKINPNQQLGQLKWFLNWSEKMLVDVPGYSHKIHKFHPIIPADTLEIMLSSIVCILSKFLKFKTDGTKPPPVLVIVDSLFAVTSGKDIASVLEGQLGNSIYNLQNAGAIKKHIQVINSLIDKVDATVLFINHKAEAAPNVVQMGGPGAPRPMGGPSQTDLSMPFAGRGYRTQDGGGRFKDFAYSANVQLEPVTAGSKNNPQYLLGKDRSIPHIKISLKKNCLGRTQDDFIVVPYRSVFIDSGGRDQEELIWFDWDAALVYLLREIIGVRALSRWFDIDANKDETRFTSETLGLHNLSITEFGAAIHANAELVRELQRNLLHIRTATKYIDDPVPELALPLGRNENAVWPDKPVVAHWADKKVESKTEVQEPAAQDQIVQEQKPDPAPGPSVIAVQPGLPPVVKQPKTDLLSGGPPPVVSV